MRRRGRADKTINANCISPAEALINKPPPAPAPPPPPRGGGGVGPESEVVFRNYKRRSGFLNVANGGDGSLVEKPLSAFPSKGAGKQEVSERHQLKISIFHR